MKLRRSLYARRNRLRTALHQKCWSFPTQRHDEDVPTPGLPAIRQQPSLASPQTAPCRFNAIRLLTSDDAWQRVGARCGVGGWLVNGMASSPGGPGPRPAAQYGKVDRSQTGEQTSSLSEMDG
jgi:hypothetical protein